MPEVKPETWLAIYSTFSPAIMRKKGTWLDDWQKMDALACGRSHGIGLGLAVRVIVRMMNGSVWYRAANASFLLDPGINL